MSRIPDIQNTIIEQTIDFLNNHRIVALAGPRGSNPDQLIINALKERGFQPILKEGAFDPNNTKFSFQKRPVYVYTDCGSLLENQELPRPINVPVVLTTMTERQRISGRGKFLFPPIQRKTISQLIRQQPKQGLIANKNVTLEKLEAIGRVPEALLEYIGVIETENNIGVIASKTLMDKRRNTPHKINEIQRPLFLETLYAFSPLFQNHTEFPAYSETVKRVAECYHTNISSRDWDKDYPNRAFLNFFVPRTHNEKIKRPVPQFREALIERCEQHKLLTQNRDPNPQMLIPQIFAELEKQNTTPENQHLRDYGLLFDKDRGGTSIRRRRKKE